MLGANVVRSLPDHFVTAHLVVSVTVVVLHPKRWNIVKRFLCIFGFINLLRAVTVTVTLLPDMSPHCLEQWSNMHPGGTGFYKTLAMYPRVFKRALKLMTKPDTTTCGDLIFSGHTSLFVLALMVVLQYLSTELVAPFNYFRYTLTKSTVRIIKRLNIFMTMLGMIAILATKFHYTIDVLLAAYLCRSVWNQYHQAALIASSPSIHLRIDSPIVKQNGLNSIIYFLEDDEDGFVLSDLWLTTEEDAVLDHYGAKDGDKGRIRRRRKKKDEEETAENETRYNSGASPLMLLLMMLAGGAVCFILFRTIISNSDYSEKSSLSFKDVKLKMDLVSKCVGKCFNQ